MYLKKKKKGNSTFDLFKWDFEVVRTGSENRATKALQTRGVGGGGGGFASQENFLIYGLRQSEMSFPAFSAEHFQKTNTTKMQWLVVNFTHL